MRHDPASAAVVVMLRSLKMYGMAQAVSDITEQGAPAFDTADGTDFARCPAWLYLRCELLKGGCLTSSSPEQHRK